METSFHYKDGCPILLSSACAEMESFTLLSTGGEIAIRSYGKPVNFSHKQTRRYVYERWYIWFGC